MKVVEIMSSVTGSLIRLCVNESPRDGIDLYRHIVVHLRKWHRAVATGTAD